MERWKDIDDFPGYQVSNQGRVRSFYKHKGYGGGASLNLESDEPKILKMTAVNPGGHLRVTLYKDGNRKSFLVHRLVAKAFIKNPKHYSVVRHMDDDPTNNTSKNLKWGTQKDNVHDSMEHDRMNYRGMHEYNASRMTPVRAICIKTGKSYIFKSQSSAARNLNISQGNIWSALKQGRPMGGYIFEYVNGGETDD